MDVRWGFVGAGNVTEVKASPSGAFTQAKSRVVAVARADRARSEEYARANGIPRAYDSVAALCADPDVNAVYVCTPHHLHKEHALAAIEAGKHVLCEKPLALTTAECQAIVRAAERAGVLLAVPFYRRFYPIAEKIKSIVDSGQLGTLISAQVVSHGYFVPPPEEAETDRRTSWRTQLETAGGGALNENGSHKLDLLFWYLGDAQSVSAEIGRFEAWYPGEDAACVTIRFVNRAIAQLDQTWCTRVPRDYLSIAGTRGHVIAENLEATSLVVQTHGEPPQTLTVDARSPTTHYPVVADFVHALSSGSQVRCSGADALRTSQIIELAYRAAHEAGRVDVPIAAPVAS